MLRGKGWKACLFMWENPRSDAFCREKTDMKNGQRGQRANGCLALEWKKLRYDECVWEGVCVVSMPLQASKMERKVVKQHIRSPIIHVLCVVSMCTLLYDRIIDQWLKGWLTFGSDIKEI